MLPELRVKRIGNHSLPVPAYKTTGAAAFDISLTDGVFLRRGETTEWLSTGFAYEVPEGYVMLVVARSGLGRRGLVLTNGTGVIDSDYRGEVKVSLTFTGADGEPDIYLPAGERIAQAMLVPVQQFKLIEVGKNEELSTTERGDAGFGSTGTSV